MSVCHQGVWDPKTLGDSGVAAGVGLRAACDESVERIVWARGSSQRKVSTQRPAEVPGRSLCDTLPESETNLLCVWMSVLPETCQGKSPAHCGILKPQFRSHARERAREKRRGRGFTERNALLAEWRDSAHKTAHVSCFWRPQRQQCQRGSSGGTACVSWQKQLPQQRRRQGEIQRGVGSSTLR